MSYLLCFAYKVSWKILVVRGDLFLVALVSSVQVPFFLYKFLGALVCLVKEDKCKLGDRWCLVLLEDEVNVVITNDETQELWQAGRKKLILRIVVSKQVTMFNN